MKKIFSMAVLALFVSMTVNAQIGESKSRKIETTVQVEDEGMASHYNRFILGYAPTAFSIDLKGVDNSTMHGFNTGWIGGWNITGRRIPLYLEGGFLMNMDFGEALYDSKSSATDIMLNFELPVNVTYRWNIPNTSIHIAPFFGIHFKINALLMNDDGDSYFDDDKFAYADDMNRFQIGMQTGVNFDLAHFTMGIGYNYDFMPICDPKGFKVTTGGFRFNIGLVF